MANTHKAHANHKCGWLGKDYMCETERSCLGTSTEAQFNSCFANVEVRTHENTGKVQNINRATCDGDHK